MVYRGMRHILWWSSCKICIYNKNKHNQLRSRQPNRMGHDFLRIRGGDIFNLWTMGKSQMSMRRPIKLSTTFLVFFLNHLFLPECGWISYCMEWEEYGQPNSNWAENHFWKTCSDFLGKENAQKRMPCLLCIHVFQFPHVLRAAGVSCVFFPSTFLAVASFFPWMGGHFL